jgi:cyclin-dependent kinase 9
VYLTRAEKQLQTYKTKKEKAKTRSQLVVIARARVTTQRALIPRIIRDLVSSPGGISGLLVLMSKEPSSSFNYPYCHEISKYEQLAKIGQGTFGEVFKARNRKTKQTVALKKILMENEKEGFPITALREIRILQLLKHENVTNLLEICRSKGK